MTRSSSGRAWAQPWTCSRRGLSMTCCDRITVVRAYGLEGKQAVVMTISSRSERTVRSDEQQDRSPVNYGRGSAKPDQQLRYYGGDDGVEVQQRSALPKRMAPIGTSTSLCVVSREFEQRRRNLFSSRTEDICRLRVEKRVGSALQRDDWVGRRYSIRRTNGGPIADRMVPPVSLFIASVDSSRRGMHPGG